MFIYFLKGQLPWQGFKIDMKEEKFEKVLEKKKNTALEVLCESFFIELGCPLEFYDYMHYVKNLRFDEKPDYPYIKSFFFKTELFMDLFEKNKFKLTDTFDWEELAVTS